MTTRSDHRELEPLKEAEAELQDLPAFTDEERALFLASLEAAQREIEDGKFVGYDKTTFMGELIEAFRSRKQPWQMTFRVRIAERARKEIREFGSDAADYSERWALQQFARLDSIFENELTIDPHRHAIFRLMGPPFRGRSFRVGRRTAYLIVFTVNEQSRVVDILRFWNSRRDPRSLFRDP